MEKILTIIVPTYNMEKYLDKCLSSLIIPDVDLMNRLEVIVVNDGSMDRSSEIAHGYADSFPDTYLVIDKENGNYGSCINTALPIAKGKYVKILDADDWFDTDALETFLNRLINENENVDLLLTDFTVVRDGTKESRIINAKDDELYSLNSTISDVMRLDNWLMHNVTYRTDILLANSYTQTEGISYTDTEWVFYPLFYLDKVRYVNVNLYQYMLGREGQTVDSAIVAKNSSAYRKIILRMLGFFLHHNTNNFSDGRRFFIEKKIILLYSTIAEIILLHQPANDYDEESMNCLESKLRQLPELYQKTGYNCVYGSGFYKMRYLIYWRKNHCRIETSKRWKMFNAIRVLLKNNEK